MHLTQCHLPEGLISVISVQLCSDDHLRFFFSMQLGPNVSIGTGVTIGAGVRVRESIILHGATLQVSLYKHAVVGIHGACNVQKEFSGYSDIVHFPEVLWDFSSLHWFCILVSCHVLQWNEVCSNFGAKMFHTENINFRFTLICV